MRGTYFSRIYWDNRFGLKPIGEWRAILLLVTVSWSGPVTGWFVTGSRTSYHHGNTRWRSVSMVVLAMAGKAAFIIDPGLL